MWAAARHQFDSDVDLPPPSFDGELAVAVTAVTVQLP
jgi:hypothetical protein